jgi:hypothetical protein
MRKILPLFIVGFLVLSGLGAVGYNEPRKSIEISEVNGGIGHINILIKNTGEVSLNNIEYEVTVKGGFFGNIDFSENGIINFVDYEASKVSKTSRDIFGFGKITITLNFDYSDTWIGTGFVFGPFIFGIKNC